VGRRISLLLGLCIGCALLIGRIILLLRICFFCAYFWSWWCVPPRGTDNDRRANCSTCTLLPTSFFASF